MTACRPIDELSAWLDGEVPGKARAELGEHLATCPECGPRVASLKAARHAVGQLEGRSAPPEAVQARIEAMALAFRAPQGRSRRMIALAAAALVVLAALSAVVLWPSPHAELTDELIADHLKYVPEEMPGEVASRDPTAVREFFAQKLPFEALVPRLPGTSLLGGRLCSLAGRKVELLFYEQGSRRLSLYVSDRAAESGCHGRGQHHVCQAQAPRGLAVILVGAAASEELERLLAGAAW